MTTPGCTWENPQLCSFRRGSDLAPNLLSPHLPSDQKDHAANTGKNVFILFYGGYLEVPLCW